jgi:hypothetical protein
MPSWWEKPIEIAYWDFPPTHAVLNAAPTATVFWAPPVAARQLSVAPAEARFLERAENYENPDCSNLRALALALTTSTTSDRKSAGASASMSSFSVTFVPPTRESSAMIAWAIWLICGPGRVASSVMTPKKRRRPGCLYAGLGSVAPEVILILQERVPEQLSRLCDRQANRSRKVSKTNVRFLGEVRTRGRAGADAQRSASQP